MPLCQLDWDSTNSKSAGAYALAEAMDSTRWHMNKEWSQQVNLQVSICGAWFQLQGSVSLCKSPSKVFAIETQLGLLQQAFHGFHVFRERSPRVCLRAEYYTEHAYVSNPRMHQCACLVRKALSPRAPTPLMTVI